jgi:hypothetical protein
MALDIKPSVLRSRTNDEIVAVRHQSRSHQGSIREVIIEHSPQVGVAPYERMRTRLRAPARRIR